MIVLDRPITSIYGGTHSTGMVWPVATRSLGLWVWLMWETCWYMAGMGMRLLGDAQLRGIGQLTKAELRCLGQLKLSYSKGNGTNWWVRGMGAIGWWLMGDNDKRLVHGIFEMYLASLKLCQGYVKIFTKTYDLYFFVID